MRKIILLLACLPFLAQAQTAFTDNFSNGFAQWQNTTNYAITAGNELRLNATAAGSSYIVAAAPVRDSASWEFYWRSELLPSATNQVQVFLQSDNANLGGNLNGYYVQIGESNADFIRLYKKTGATATLLATSTLSFPAVPTRNIAARMRLTRNVAGDWKMYADTTGGTNYSLQASANDNTYPSGAYFGFNTKYTVTNLTKFVYDDVRVAPLFTDNIAPSLTSASAISATAVDARFDEALTAVTANNAANYTLNNGGIVTAAAQDATDLALVHLTVQPLVSGTNYTLTTAGLKDIAGNTSVAQNRIFLFVNVQAAATFDVLINEIFADTNPAPAGLPVVEWLELYNRSAKYIDAATLQIKTGSSSLQTLPNYILAPNSYTIITKTGNEPAFSPSGTALGVSSFSLSDAGATVILQDLSGTIINTVTYADTWYNDATKKIGGWSLELKSPLLPCATASNWTATNNATGGTPGAQNSVFTNTPDTQAPSIVSATATNATTVQVVFSEDIYDAASLAANNFSVSNGVGAPTLAVTNGNNIIILTFGTNLPTNTPLTLTAAVLRDCSGNASTAPNRTVIFSYTPTVAAGLHDILINEIMADVNPTVGLPAVEWLELYNRSNKYINAADLSIKTGSSALSPLPSAVLAPNSYTIITKTGSEAALAAYGTVLGVASFSLTDAGATIVLQDAAASEINSVTYADTWYNDGTKDGGGWSLERINPSQPCATASNWTASNNVSGGTPGAQNSVFASIADTQSPALTSATALDANTVQVVFSEVLFDAASLSANNFSVSNGLGTPASATLVGDNTLNLTFTNAIPPNVLLTITAATLRDCSSNASSNKTATFTYRPTVAASRYDIILNEIFVDPSNSLGVPPQEYIELYNRSNKYIQLAGMKIVSGNSDCVLPFYVFEPNTYLIITGTGGEDFTTYGRTFALSNFISLSNPTATTGDDVRILNTSGVTIDAILYDKTWWKGKATTKALERVNAMKPCNESDNWAASTDLLGGTPGSVNSVNETAPDEQAPIILRTIVETPNSIEVFFNEAMTGNLTPTMFTIDNAIGAPISVSLGAIYYSSVRLLLGTPLQPSVIYTISFANTIKDCMGNAVAANTKAKVVLPEAAAKKDIVINEIMNHPKSGGIQFIELYNRSKKVIDLKDFIIAARSTDTTERIVSNYLLFPDDYVVLTENDFLLQQQNQLPHPEKVIQMPLPTLSFAGDNFFLLSGGILVDSIGYSEGWHSALLGATGSVGVSLERINPDGYTNDPNNWHSAAESVGFSTPTQKNSQFFKSSGTNGTEVAIEPAIFSPDGDGVDDFTNVVFKEGQPGYIATVIIYDAQGRPVKSLAKTQLLGTADVLQWDGTYASGEKAPMGVYVFAISMFNTTGDVKEFKKTAVLAQKL
jgi:Lamin Tail Domain/CHU_C Type IX secretion signal domain